MLIRTKCKADGELGLNRIETIHKGTERYHVPIILDIDSGSVAYIPQHGETEPRKKREKRGKSMYEVMLRHRKLDRYYT